MRVMEARSTPETGRHVPEVSIVAPAHNEEDYLADAVHRVVEGLRARDLDFEVLICENGSTDRTRPVAAGLADELAEVRYLSTPVADYGRALRAGFLAAEGRLVVNFDVDLIDLGFLDRALDLERDDGADVVIGSKRTAGADDSRPVSRRIVTWVFSTLLRHGFGLRATDTHGSKLLRKSSMAALVACCGSGSDVFDTELVLRAERAGRRVVEVPVRVAEQRPARTAIAGRIPRTLVGLGRLRIRLWREGVAGPAGSRIGRRPPRASGPS
jgi:glycosyltransferase involved in cell wall biosynthesis